MSTLCSIEQKNDVTNRTMDALCHDSPQLDDDICDENNFPSLKPLAQYGRSKVAQYIHLNSLPVNYVGMNTYKWANDGVYWTHFGLMLRPDVVTFFTVRNSKRLKEIEMKTKSPLIIENDVIGGKVHSFIVFYRGSVPYSRDGIHDFKQVESMTEAMKQVCSFVLSVVSINREKTSKDSEATPSSPSNNSVSSEQRSSSISCASTTSSSDEKFTLIKREPYKESKDRSDSACSNTISESVRIPHDSIGWIFGKRGKRLESIMKKTDTTIILCSTHKQNTKLLVQSNERGKVDKGVKLVLEALAEIGRDS